MWDVGNGKSKKKKKVRGEIVAPKKSRKRKDEVWLVSLTTKKYSRPFLRDLFFFFIFFFFFSFCLRRTEPIENARSYKKKKIVSRVRVYTDSCIRLYVYTCICVCIPYHFFILFYFFFFSFLLVANTFLHFVFFLILVRSVKKN